MFWGFSHKAPGILVRQLRIKPTLPSLEGKVLTTELPGKSLPAWLTNFCFHVHTCCAVRWPWRCMLSAKFPINACRPGFSHISSHWTIPFDSLAANILPGVHCTPLAWTTLLTSTAVCLWQYLTARGVHGNQFSSVISDSATPWTAAHQASLSITNSRSLLKLTSIMSVMPSNRLILCCPLLLPPSIFPSIRVFSNESVLHHQVAKVLEFQLQY